MEVIPAINCKDFECVREKIRKIKEYQSPWVHIDVSDGEFGRTITWNNPEELLGLGEDVSYLKLEVHLMVEEPQVVVEDWLRAGASRVIIHQEALTDGWPIILDKVERYDAELGLAILPGTPPENLMPYLKSISLVQLLAVSPGPSGQKFDERVLDKIKFLRREEGNFSIEVDGGINPQTAQLVRDAGGDIIVSGSYIWESKNPREAFKELQEIQWRKQG